MAARPADTLASTTGAAHPAHRNRALDRDITSRPGRKGRTKTGMVAILKKPSFK
jgi:hypothetical protein